MPGGKRRHQRRRVVGRGEDVDVTDGLPPPAQRARVGAALADRGECVHHLGRRAQRHVEQHPLTALPVHLDAGRDPLLAPGPETGQAIQPARLDRRRQVVHRLDAEVPVELQGTLRAQAGHPGQL